VRSCRDVALCIVATFRADDLRPGDEPASLMASLLAEGQRIALGGLAEEDIAALVARRAGSDPGQEVVRALREVTAGNPLFLDETVGLLVRTGELDVAAIPRVGSELVPDRVRAIMRERVARFTGADGELLAAAALVGPEFGLALLEAVCRLPADAILDWLGRAERSGLVAKLPERVGRYRFVHDVVRQARVADLDPLVRARLHLQIAEHLERAHAGDPGPHVAEMAHHFLSALPLGDAERAAEYAARAASDARSRFAPEDVVHWLQRAVDGLEGRPVAAARRSELLLRLGQAWHWAGDTPRARTTLLRVVEAAKEQADADLLARAVIAYAETHVETGFVDESLVRLLESALAAVGAGSAGHRAHLESRLATALYFAPGSERGRALTEGAVERARRAGDARVLAYALVARALALWSPDGLAERRAMADEAVRLARGARAHVVQFEAHLWRVLALLESGEMPAAAVAVEEMHHDFRPAGDPRILAHVDLFRATRALMTGDLAAAEALNAKVLAEALRWQVEGLSQFASAQLFLVRSEGRRLAEVEEPVRYFVGRFPGFAIWRAALAWLLLETGRPEEARGHLDALAADGFAAVRRDGNWFPTLAVLAEVCTGLGDRAAARSLHALLLPYPRHVVVVALGAGVLGSCSRYLGSLAATFGETALARRHLGDAVAMEVRMGAAVPAARTKLALSRLLLDSGAAGDAARADRYVHEVVRESAARGLTRLVTSATDLTERGLPPRPASEAEVATFLRSGDVWLLGRGSLTFQLRHSVGLEQIHRLLRAPGHDVPALDLGSSPEPADVSSAEAGQWAVGALDTVPEPILDARARREYRERLVALREELEAAEGHNDVGRAGVLRAEMKTVAEQLAAASGLHGRARRSSSPAERARINVTRTVRDALRRIRAQDPLLADHLGRSIHTGRLCGYTPDPSRPIAWRL
jgi:hypothetical protein